MAYSKGLRIQFGGNMYIFLNGAPKKDEGGNG